MNVQTVVVNYPMIKYAVSISSSQHHQRLNPSTTTTTIYYYPSLLLLIIIYVHTTPTPSSVRNIIYTHTIATLSPTVFKRLRQERKIPEQ